MVVRMSLWPSKVWIVRMSVPDSSRNMALREHASQLANLVQDWVSSVHGFVSVARKIKHFANFRHAEAQDQEDDEL